MRHPHSTKKMNQLKVNELILTSSGHVMILAKGPVIPDGEGCYASATVIHTNPCNDYHPFTVHVLIYNDDQDLWMLSAGDYCRDLTTALEIFETRTGTKEGSGS